jgi:hypothetical protein
VWTLAARAKVARDALTAGKACGLTGLELAALMRAESCARMAHASAVAAKISVDSWKAARL